MQPIYAYCIQYNYPTHAQPQLQFHSILYLPRYTRYANGNKFSVVLLTTSCLEKVDRILINTVLLSAIPVI